MLLADYSKSNWLDATEKGNQMLEMDDQPSKAYPHDVRVIVDQPPPVKNNRPSIQDLVIKDIEERKALGLARYGTLLQPFNGRDALVDAYQEALDLCQYLRQAIEERSER